MARKKPAPKPEPASQGPLQEVAKSWRAIKQSGVRQADTPAARSRRNRALVRFAGGALLVVGLAAGAWYGLNFAKSSLENLRFAASEQPVRNILFYTDGVLTREWLDDVIDLPRGTGMMDVDIFALRDQIEAEGQVKSVLVERSFPDTIRITLTERVPVLRARAAGSDGREIILLIGGDGIVYEGFNYSGATISSLPAVANIRFRRDGKDGIMPVHGMDTVTRLLTLARDRNPELYRTWKIVSFEKYRGDPDAPDAVIKIIGNKLEMVFATENFEEQLDRLADVVNDAQRRDPSLISGKRLDLTVAGRVYVR